MRALTEEEGNAIWEAATRAESTIAAAMPTEERALRIMCDAYHRLIKLGWHSGIYAPKDGTVFQVVECGSTGIFDCYYAGDWPDGNFMVMDGHDVYPQSSVPPLFRLKNASRTA